MSSEQQPDHGKGKPGNDPGSFTQEVRYSQISARVPEKIGRGIFATGSLVMQGPHEFVIDFVVRMAQPHQIAARIVVPPTLMPSLIGALRENLSLYSKNFGPPPALPQPPQPATPPTIEEIYDNLKLPDDLLSGVYANAAMIVHSPSEFCFDFITNFYPRSAVSCRVYQSAAQVPPFLNTLTRAYQQYQQKIADAQHRPPEPPLSQ